MLVALFKCIEQTEAFAGGRQNSFGSSALKGLLGTANSNHQAHVYMKTLIPTDS